MKTYLFRFDTNYDVAGIIITTNKGLDFAKKTAKKNGAWDLCDITEIGTNTEGYVTTINYGE